MAILVFHRLIPLSSGVTLHLAKLNLLKLVS